MEIVLIKEANTSKDILSQVKNNIIARIQQAVNVMQTDYTYSLILPVVPNGIKFPVSAKIEDYDGIEKPYSLPNHKGLEKISWNSIFPTKDYSFNHVGCSLTPSEYIEFFNERMDIERPFRLIAYNYPSGVVSGINGQIQRTYVNVVYDGFVLVEKFEGYYDLVGDYNYSVSLTEFNENIVTPQVNLSTLTQIFTAGAVNQISRYALQMSGLI